jgi:WD40 repeat protein
MKRMKNCFLLFVIFFIILGIILVTLLLTISEPIGVHANNMEPSMHLTANPTARSPGLQLPTPWPTVTIESSSTSAISTQEKTSEPLPIILSTPMKEEPGDPLVARYGMASFGSLALSPCGEKLAVASSRGIYLYQARTFNEIWFHDTGDGVTSVHFSPDGNILAAGLSEGKVIFIDIRTGNQKYGFDLLERSADIVFSPDWEKLVAVYGDGTAVLLNPENGEEIFTFTNDEFFGGSPTFSPDGQSLIINTIDVGLWNVHNGERVYKIDVHFAASVAFSPDGSIFALGTSPLTFWETTSGQRLSTLDTFKYDLVRPVAFSPDGETFAFGTKDGVIYTYSLANPYTHREFIQDGKVRGFVFSPDGSTLYTTHSSHHSQSSVLTAWNPSSGQKQRELQTQTLKIVAAADTDQGATVATVWYWGDSNISLWNLSPAMDTLTPLMSLSYDNNLCNTEIEEISLSKDGNILAISYPYCDNAILLWQTSTGEILHILKRPWNFSDNLALSPDGSLLASEYGPTDIALWDTASGDIIHIFPNMDTAYNSALEFSPDGDLLAMSDIKGKVYIYDIESRKRLHVFHGHQPPTVKVTFSHDGAKLATGGWDFTFILWDLISGEELGRGRQRDYVLNLEFSPDDAILATSTYGDVFLWDAETLEPLGTMKGHLGEVSLIKFSSDGSLVTTSGFDNTVILWDLKAVLSEGY